MSNADSNVPLAARLIVLPLGLLVGYLTFWARPGLGGHFALVVGGLALIALTRRGLRRHQDYGDRPIELALFSGGTIAAVVNGMLLITRAAGIQ